MLIDFDLELKSYQERMSSLKEEASPDEIMHAFLEEIQIEDEDLFDFGQRLNTWLKGRLCCCPLKKNAKNTSFEKIKEQCLGDGKNFNKDDFMRAPGAFRVFLLGLYDIERPIRIAILDDYFGGRRDELDFCVKHYLIPLLMKHFNEAIEEHKYYLGEKLNYDVGVNTAIADFVDKGHFAESLKYFRGRESLWMLDEEFCAKVFYQAFKEHFDSRQGMGYMEMINVGKSHPEILERMQMMEEYEDIRAAMLRLQLTGQIRSDNYR